MNGARFSLRYVAIWIVLSAIFILDTLRGRVHNGSGDTWHDPLIIAMPLIALPFVLIMAMTENRRDKWLGLAPFVWTIWLLFNLFFALFMFSEVSPSGKSPSKPEVIAVVALFTLVVMYLPLRKRRV